jgi:hypothetical protein
MKPFVRTVIPVAAFAAVTFAIAGCGNGDNDMSMRDENPHGPSWGMGVDPEGDDDDNPPGNRWDRDRHDHRTTYRRDYDSRPMNQGWTDEYQQVGDVQPGGEMGSDPELRSPYSGDRYEDMGLYGNQPRDID